MKETQGATFGDPLSDELVLQARGLVKTFGTGPSQVQALRGVDLDVPPRQFLALIGPSGSGKSTLLNVLGGIEIPSAGSVRLENTDLTTLNDDALTLLRRRRIGYVSQAFNLLPTLTALENAGFPLILDGIPAAEARKRAQDILDRLGLKTRADHYPGTLSGGEQQRVAIARALLINPSLILADEPTGNLDRTNAGQIMDVFRGLVQDLGKSVVVATHDLAFALNADRVVMLRDGSIQGDLTGADVTLEKLESLLQVGAAPGFASPDRDLKNGDEVRLSDQVSYGNAQNDAKQSEQAPHGTPRQFAQAVFPQVAAFAWKFLSKRLRPKDRLK